MQRPGLDRILIPFRLLLAFCFVLLFFQLGLVITRVDPKLRLIIIDFLTPVFSLVASIILLYGAAQYGRLLREYRILWLLVALGVAACFVGDVLWLTLEVFLHQQPYPSIADFFYLLYYPFTLAAIFHLPAIHRSRAEQLKITLDTAIVILSAFLFFWSFLIGPIMLNPDENPIQHLVSVAYPVFDLALMWGLTVLMVRPYRDRSYIPFLMVGIGIGLQILSDVFYTLQTTNGTFITGTMVDLGWQVSYLMNGIAGMWLIHLALENRLAKTIPIHGVQNFFFERVWILVPFVWMLAGYLLLVISHQAVLPIDPRMVLVGVGIIICLVVIRQYIAMNENLTLSRHLQRELVERIEVDRALRESEMRYRAIVEDQTELICRFKADGTLSFVNEAYCRYFGKTRTELVGSLFIPAIPEEDHLRLRQHVEQLSVENPAGTIEFRIIQPDGVIRWLQWTNHVIFNDAGEILEYASVGRDVSEKRWVDEELDRRAKEFSALYDMSMEINSQLDLTALLHSVLQKTTRLLDAPMGGLYLRVPGSDLLTLEASHNLPHELAKKPIPVGQGCLGIVAQTGRPMMIGDYPEWSEPDDVFARHGLRRVLSLPLRLREEVIGVIMIADHLKTGSFSEDDGRLITLFADQVAIAVGNARLYEQAQFEIAQRKRIEVMLTSTNEMLEQRILERTTQLVTANERLNVELTERKRAEEQLRASLAEKEVLLKEVHHRVKNNLQVISSLLNMQFSHAQDPRTLAALSESQNRVRSMALIHEKIYQSHNLAEVNFGEYIHSLTAHLFRSYRVSRGYIRLNVEVEPIALSVDYAVPCGLILNELISNALKHAFPGGRNGEITIQLRRAENNQIRLAIADNGIGLPQPLDIDHSSSLGLKLIHMLVTQLDGSLVSESNGGTRFIIHFPDCYQRSKS